MLNYRTIRCIFAGLVVSSFMLPNSAIALPNVGTSLQADEPNSDATNPLKWIGKKFILLEKPKDLQSLAYFGFRLRLEDGILLDRNSDLEDPWGHLIYNKFVGDMLSVVDFHAEANSVTIIEFRDEQKAIPVFYRVSGHKISGVAPADEVDLVRIALKGQSLWCKNGSLKQYDAQLGKVSNVSVRVGDSLTLVDVVWGTDDYAPVWVILRTGKGVTGYCEVAGSPINKGRAYFDCRSEFYLIDPWKNHLLFPEVSRTAKTPGRGYGVVRLGMDEVEVRHNIGDADRVNTDTSAAGTTEQWVYDFPDHDRYIYFRNGKVSSISEHQTTHPTDP